MLKKLIRTLGLVLVLSPVAVVVADSPTSADAELMQGVRIELMEGAGMNPSKADGGCQNARESRTGPGRETSRMRGEKRERLHRLI